MSVAGGAGERPPGGDPEARWRNLLESAPDAIVVVDEGGRIVIANGQAEALFGWSRGELIGQPIEILVPEAARAAHTAARTGFGRAPRTRPMGSGRGLAGRRRDGTTFPAEISLSPLLTDAGLLVTAIVRDTSERRRYEERIEASLREKEALLREVHHRVKNNLQVTSSLLKLQSAAIADPQARAVLAECQNRIRSMALVHEKLYQSDDLARVNFMHYAESLGALLMRSFGEDPARIAFAVEGEAVLVSLQTAIPCGLVLNELVSNALEHAFPAGRLGKILVRIQRGQDDRWTLSVRDDGIGLPADLDLDHVGTLGLQLVRTLAEQLSARLEIRRASGTEVLLHL